jgi:flavin-dependent dehydrogenase
MISEIWLALSKCAHAGTNSVSSYWRAKTTLNRSENFDAVIVGAGIAGCAAAHHLVAAGRKVALLHRGSDIPGTESVPPTVARTLHEFAVHCGSAFSEVIAWWGADAPALMTCLGGRIVQRAAIAQQLRERVVETGARLLTVRATPILARNASCWGVRYKEANGFQRVLVARHIVDASGRAAVAARLIGARRESTDNLCCLSVSVRDPRCIGVWTESVANGWWNLCSDGNEATLSFFSSPQIVRQAKHDVPQQFSKIKHLTKLIIPSQFGPALTRACGSSILDPCAGPGWIAIGDAAMTFQPLASAGIAKALMDAAETREALDQPEPYTRSQKTKFHDYVRQLKCEYNMERRWREAPFWTTQIGYVSPALRTPLTA